MVWILFLLVSCAVAGVSCARLCLAAAEAAQPAAGDPARPAGADRTHGTHDLHAPGELSRYEAAFLSGGPLRVTDLALVTMHRGRRLLLAHTGWATVVDPEGTDDLERSVIGAIGPGGQSEIAAVRSATAAADAVRLLADRLVAAGLAVPDAARGSVARGVRAVRGAALLTAALALASALLPAGLGPGGTDLAWFVLPLVLTGGCLVVARIEVHPYTRWASPAGQSLLTRVEVADPLTALAVGGVRVLDDPALRTALRSGRTVHRGH
ncbi:TIGR04222 domain-containing membrane protein [Streptomyces sp. NPDC001941]|uniref:TIGR04222 domain-containing membrane protein n=1 Tax=Streptomyces sp. NPDC001941 TaxID=3154659 RepID=UPI003323A40E